VWRRRLAGDLGISIRYKPAGPTCIGTSETPALHLLVAAWLPVSESLFRISG